MMMSSLLSSRARILLIPQQHKRSRTSSISLVQQQQQQLRRKIFAPLLLLFLLLLLPSSPIKQHHRHRHGVKAFVAVVPVVPVVPRKQITSTTRTSTRTSTATRSSSTTATQLRMVYDFFKRRSEEGMDQLKSLGDAASKGQLGRGLIDIAVYSANANQAFANGLSKSRNRLLQNLESLMSGVTSEEWLENLEDVLLQADLGASTTEDIINEVESLRLSGDEVFSRDDLMSILRGKLMEALDIDDTSTTSTTADEGEAIVNSNSIQFSTDESTPTILFVMGANGMGKTTTIGKLAHRLKTEGNQTVLMAACDTFRAGAVEQLEQWADRAGADIIGPDEQAKTPAAVLYKALDVALSSSNNKKYDTVLVDTSGRLSNNDMLTAELAKMKRVIQKRMSVDGDGTTLNNAVPHETLLVLDAAQGRMALDSAKTWNKEIGLTGLILTKLDGSAKGGSVVSISRDLQLPVKLIGVGEGIEDLRDFERDRFVDGLLGIGSAGGKRATTSSSSMIGGSKKPSQQDNEGQMLAARLEDMRKERDARAKTMQKDKKKEKELVGVASPSSSAPTVDESDVKLVTTPVAAAAAATTTQPPNNNVRRKPKPKNKKKKKRKGKK